MISANDQPDFSDVPSGGSSTAPQAAGSGRTCTVVRGDSLSKIAKTTYGDGSKGRMIYEADKATIKNPDLIYPDQVLTLPDA